MCCKLLAGFSHHQRLGSDLRQGGEFSLHFLKKTRFPTIFQTTFTPLSMTVGVSSSVIQKNWLRPVISEFMSFTTFIIHIHINLHRYYLAQNIHRLLTFLQTGRRLDATWLPLLMRWSLPVMDLRWQSSWAGSSLYNTWILKVSWRLGGGNSNV